MKESKASVDGQVYATFAFVEDQIWFGGKCRPGLRSSLHVNAQEEVENPSWENLSIEAGLASLECMVGMAELPSVENFICILQKCRKKKSLEFSTSMHVHVCNSGLEAHRALGNFLIPMFVECGSMSAAQQVFSRLVHRNEHSWTSLIQGNIECGESQHGLYLYQKMREDCVPPSRHTLVALLKACTKLKFLERGQDILAEVVKQGWESDKFVGNTLVDMYAKCGALAEAQTVFDKLLLRDVVSWTALITGYAERGLGDEALSFFNQMQVEGVSPDAVTFVCCLKVCGSIGAIDRGREVHAEIAREGFERDVSIGNTLVDMYAKCGLLKEAREVFDELLHRDVVSWNVLITGYAEHGLGVEALKCLEQMQLEGVSQDDVTYVGSLKACGSTGAIDRGRELHVEIAKGKYRNNPVVGNTLVDMYAKCGLFAEAREVLDELQARDVISWNALIAGYAEHGLGEAALDCLEYMESEGASPNAISIICSLKACGSIAALDRGLELHNHVILKGFERDPSVANTLLDMYAKCGSLAEAQEMFDTLPVRDVVSWTALIAGFAEHKLVDEALNGLKQMQTEDVSLNALTFACSLKACGTAGALAKGQELHTEIMKEGFESVTLVGNTLVDMYFKCGSIAEAREVFDELPVRDVISWTALLTGYAEHELGEEALNVLEQMQSDGVCPNIVTYVSSLKACSSLGAIGKCQELHTRVVQLGLERDSFVGNTLVDMYAKCGRLAEAQEVFNKLPAQDVVLWNALIAGHIEHGLDKETLKCWDEIQTKGIPPNAITFICSLKACASLGAMARGREIHNEIAKKNLEGEPFVGNTLVDLYAKCGSLAEAQTVFDKLPVQDLVSWTALIAGYAEHGLTEEALNCLKQMQLEGMIPDDIAFVCCLKACGSTGALEKGQIIHTEIAREGFENELLVGNTLLDMYAKCGSLEEAKEVFSQLPVQDVVLWNALIAGYVDSGHSVQALNLLKGMQSEGLSPNDVTLVCWLKACASTGNVNQGKEMHLEVVKKGFEKDCFVYNALICMYFKCGSLAEAQKVFDELLVYDEVSWNALLSGYAEHGLVEEALNCLEQMQLEGVPPNVISWSAAILGCAEQGENKKAFLLFSQMQEQGLLPNSVTFLNLLKACSKAADIETGKMIHALIFRLDGLEESMATTLVDMYGKCGCMVEAHQVFDATASRDLAGWNSLITGYARQGESELVFSLFERMREEGVRPDDVTFLTVLTVCSHAGLVEKGLEYFEAMILEYAIPPNVKHQNCMVDLLSRAGQLNEAVLMLEKTPFQSDLAMWSIVLAACRKWGNVELGKHAFDCVVNLDENYATAFVMMSNIYADAHLMKEGKSFETFEVSS